MSNQYYFFGTRTTFIHAAPNIFCRVNGALLYCNFHLELGWQTVCCCMTQCAAVYS